jgi:hypothetical protein
MLLFAALRESAFGTFRTLATKRTMSVYDAKADLATARSDLSR